MQLYHKKTIIDYYETIRHFCIIFCCCLFCFVITGVTIMAKL